MATSAATPFKSKYDGVLAYGLRSDTVEIVVTPAVGAKIVSLRNRRSGREWMWSPPDHRALRVMRVGAPFDSSSLVGGDECFPTIAACTWQGRELPDHGEVWGISWFLDEQAFGRGQLRTGVSLPVSRFWLERSLTLAGDTVTFDYAVRNDAFVPQEFMWAFHPLMAITNDDEIVLEPTPTTVRLEAAMNLALGAQGDPVTWPEPLPGVRLDRLELGGAAAVKLFSEERAVSSAAIRHRPTGEELRFEFDPRVVNTLGIWLTRGGWNGYHHLALEPGIGAPDALDQAVTRWKRFGLVLPGDVMRWRFRIRLTT